jgi:hypothetical protein
MKKIFNYSMLAFLLFSISSCDKGLEQLNKNRVSPTALDPALLLNNAVISASYPTRTVIFDMGIVQQIVSPNGGVLAGANFNQDSRDASTASIWGAYYQNVIKYTHDVIVRTKDLPARSNLYNMARIFQAYAFMVLTDEYGSIPYSEGGAGYTDQNFFPKYDAQQEIYPKIIQEFTEASAALSASGTIETSDVLYSGNIAQWKKFGYSLLLRAGMRLSKIDPAKAKTTVQAALAGGVIMLNTDNAMLKHDANYASPIGNMLNSTEAANFYLVKAFVDTLKLKNDPRLSAIAIRYKGATSGTTQTVASGTTAPADQIGMPMGYDNGTIGGKATADGLASFYDYSQLDRRRMGKNTAPVFFVTAAQTQLLLAEARFRDWITTGTAAQYFSDGIKAHMDQLATYDAGSAVAPGARDTYVANNPLTPGNELQQINTQYWIGYPALTPNPYASADIPAGTFIRRITYPTSEISVNTENLNAAITSLGPDKLSTRVWWDKQ